MEELYDYDTVEMYVEGKENTTLVGLLWKFVPIQVKNFTKYDSAVLILYKCPFELEPGVEYHHPLLCFYYGVNEKGVKDDNIFISIRTTRMILLEKSYVPEALKNYTNCVNANKVE